MSSSDALANLNSATLGANMPVITLPDGQKVQTGTVGALLVNIKKYDAMVESANSAPAQDKTTLQTEIEEMEQKFHAALPLLLRVGMFDLFAPDEWIGGKSAGRTKVGELAKAQMDGSK